MVYDILWNCAPLEHAILTTLVIDIAKSYFIDKIEDIKNLLLILLLIISLYASCDEVQTTLSGLDWGGES